jgi:hypothetical protein
VEFQALKKGRTRYTRNPGKANGKKKTPRNSASRNQRELASSAERGGFVDVFFCRPRFSRRGTP